MKILMIAGYANSKKHYRLSKYTTGLGIIIQSILKEMGSQETVELFCSVVPICKSIKENEYRIIANIGFISPYDIFKIYKIFKDKSIRHSGRVKFKEFVYCVLEFIYLCRLNRILRKKQYDIIHIHELSRISYYISILCENIGIPYLLTIHNYYGNSDVKGYQEIKKYERLILSKSDIYFSTVSTGVKRRIVREFTNSCDSLRVILNGSENRKKVENKDKSILIKFGIDNKEKKLILCPGTISDRKNQIQIVRAFSLLNEDEKNHIYIAFMGDDRLHGQLQKTICEYHLEKQLKYLGSIHKDMMPVLYSCADAVISASINESFGLIFTEGFVYGIPSITYADLDAIGDIYNKKTMVIANERTDVALKNAIQKWDKLEWDKNYIYDYSKQYTVRCSVKGYIEYYKEIIT